MLKKCLVVILIASACSRTCMAQASSGLEARRSLAKATLEQINTAADNFKKKCGVTVFQDIVPGEVDCGNGRQTIGEAWGRTLEQAGYPATPQARRLAAQNLGLDSRTSLVLFLAPADNEKLGYLIRALKQIENDGN
ncbi:hypothetical protein [Bradyrhizobium sp. USDA 4473]